MVILQELVTALRDHQTESMLWFYGLIVREAEITQELVVSVEQMPEQAQKHLKNTWRP